MRYDTKSMKLNKYTQLTATHTQDIDIQRTYKVLIKN